MVQSDVVSAFSALDACEAAVSTKRHSSLLKEFRLLHDALYELQGKLRRGSVWKNPTAAAATALLAAAEEPGRGC